MAATQNYSTSTASGIYKSALTQVKDLATKHNLAIEFFDCREHGPVRERIFSTTLTVGSLSAVGQAHNKKQARARAAANILEPFTEMCLDLENNQANPGKACTLALKPNGVLFEAAQANGWGWPQYTLVDFRLLPWGWLFTIMVSVQGVEVVGTGPTKKAAKQNAAAKILEILGFECPMYNPLLDKKDNASTTTQVDTEQVEEEDLTEERISLEPKTYLDQDCEDMCRSPGVIIEEIVEYLDEASVPCETDTVQDSIILSEILLEIQTESEEQILFETQDQEAYPETETQTAENVGPEMSSEPEEETIEVFGEDEAPVSDAGGPSQVLRETEVFPGQEEVTAPESDLDSPRI